MRERAERLRELGRLDEAEQAARAGLATEPQDPALLGTLSAVLLGAGRHVEGLAAAEAALAVAPGAERAHRLRGLHLSMLDRHQEAVEAGYAAVSLAPLSDAPATAYARILQRARRPVDALAVARRVVELAPGEAGSHLLLADIASDLPGKDNRELARQAYAETLRLDPANAAARHDLAVLDARSRRPARALAGLIAAGRLDPTLPEVRATVTAVLWQLSWRLRIWLIVATLGTLVVSMGRDAQPNGTGGRIAAGTVLVATAVLGWWTLRGLPARSWPILRATAFGDRPLALTYGALALCLVVYLAVLVTGIGPLAAAVWLILVGLGWLAVGVRLFRRSR